MMSLEDGKNICKETLLLVAGPENIERRLSKAVHALGALRGDAITETHMRKISSIMEQYQAYRNARAIKLPKLSAHDAERLQRLLIHAIVTACMEVIEEKK